MNSSFWHGNDHWLGFNEGGGPPVTFNIVLRNGWLPVGFYLAIWLGFWVRCHSRNFGLLL
jgi:hypothetical protein